MNPVAQQRQLDSDRVDFQAFEAKAERSLPIAVVGGAGYVGTVTAVGLAHLGHRVTAIDVHKERLAQLRQGVSPFQEPYLPELLQQNLAAGRLSFADGASAESVPKVVFIAVNTPRRTDGEADLSQIIDVALILGRTLTAYTVIAVKSTVPVGAHITIRRVLDRSGLVEGTDYDLVANPEFLREGHAVVDFFYPDRIVIGGGSGLAIAAVRELFEPLNAPILETSTVNAQMIKYAANAFLAMRVSFVNEIAGICERLGADIDAVTDALGYDRRIGRDYFRPGLGFSGPCLPKDLESLIRVAEEAGYEPALLRAIHEKNEHQRRLILAKVSALLGASLYGRRIGVLGLTFKPGTNDIRNSTVPVLIDYLVRRGADVYAHDPAVGATTRVPGRLGATAYDVADGADLLMIATPWEEYRHLDYGKIRQMMRVPNIVDAANLCTPGVMRSLGFTYVSVGRP